MSPKHRCATVMVLFTAGCSVWRPLPGAGLATPRSERLEHARIAMRYGTLLELDDARITPDSIIGFGGESRARFAVERREVVSVDARQPDAPKTFLAGAFAGLSLLALWVAALIAAYSNEAT